MLKAQLGTLPMGNLNKQRKAIKQFSNAATPRLTHQSVWCIVSKSLPTYRSLSASPSGAVSAME